MALPLPAVASGAMAVSRLASHFGCVGAVVDSGVFDTLLDLLVGQQAGKDLDHLLAQGQSAGPGEAVPAAGASDDLGAGSGGAEGGGLGLLPAPVAAAAVASLGSCALWPAAAAELEALGAPRALKALASAHRSSTGEAVDGSASLVEATEAALTAIEHFAPLHGNHLE
jgi:hypothetical protein